MALDRLAGQSECDISWPILLSVAFNESSLRRGAVGRTKDYGLTQINHRNVLIRNLDWRKLMTDEHYSLSVACDILTENKIGYSKKFTYWLGLYRSGTRLKDPRVRQSAIRYDRIVRRTAAQIGLK